MSDELQHECGLAALYRLDPPGGDVAHLLPRMLLDVQNRGQLAAGMTSYDPGRAEPLRTFKDVGSVQEAFRMTHRGKFASILEQCSGRAAIGHTRYGTSGADDDARYAQPFERTHGRLWKWFSLAFNGNLANYDELRERLLSKRGYHFTLDTDTEILMHSVAYRLRMDNPPDLVEVMSTLAEDLDGAFNIAFLDATGRLFVSRDPLGFRPLCYAVQDGLFAAANESAALANLGFRDIRHLQPGEMAIVEDSRLRIERYAESTRQSRCMFEWVYFSNVASEIDGAGVYRSRANIGRILAELEDQPVDGDTIVVPVPDTAKAAADAYAFKLGVPCMEGVIRNRYVGRTFIQPAGPRESSARSKYATVPDVLSGKRIMLVEDSIVRSLTLGILVRQLREDGAREIHVRVACPPIIGPCFYGINMYTFGELFAADFVGRDYDGDPSPALLEKMAADLGVDSLRYLPVSELGRGIGVPQDSLCSACLTRRYPTSCGEAAGGWHSYAGPGAGRARWSGRRGLD